MRTRRFLAVLGTPFIAAVLPGAAFAQPRGDAGEFRILQARYGTPGRNVDVTDRLQRIARRDRPVQVTNDLFGVDPAFGEVKTLRIYARGRDNAVRIFEYREGDFVDGAQFSSWNSGNWGQGQGQGQGGWQGGWGGAAGPVAPQRPQLTIVSARYGDGPRGGDVTDRIRMLVRNGRIDLGVENDMLGMDPAPGRNKTLHVVYTVGGQRREVRVPEHGRLTLP